VGGHRPAEQLPFVAIDAAVGGNPFLEFAHLPPEHDPLLIVPAAEFDLVLFTQARIARQPVTPDSSFPNAAPLGPARSAWQRRCRVVTLARRNQDHLKNCDLFEVAENRSSTQLSGSHTASAGQRGHFVSSLPDGDPTFCPER
jgi:hypothetical protein